MVMEPLIPIPGSPSRFLVPGASPGPTRLCSPRQRPGARTALRSAVGAAGGGAAGEKREEKREKSEKKWKKEGKERKGRKGRIEKK